MDDQSMFNKQKSKSDNYKMLTGGKSVGCVKSINEAENKQNLELNEELDGDEQTRKSKSETLNEINNPENNESENQDDNENIDLVS